MKIKIIVGILGIAILGTIGLQSYTGLSANLKECNSLQDTDNTLTTQINELNMKSQSLSAQLSEAGADVFLDNMAMANTFANLNGAKISSITALHTETDGTVSEILSVTDFADVAFFTDNVDKIRYTFSLTDVDTFIDSLRNTIFISTDLEIYSGAKLAIIEIPSSYALYNNTSIQSGSDTAVIPENSTEASDTIVLPESSGVYDNDNYVTEDSSVPSTEVSEFSESIGVGNSNEIFEIGGEGVE